MPAPRVIPKRAVVSWVLYDLANTIFSMGVVSLYFSLFVQDAVGVAAADRVYGLITSVSMGLIFVLSPLLGSMTDRAARRMPFLFWSTGICCIGTALLARGPFALSVVLFVVANAAYQAGLQFYDALLPEVSNEQNRGRISGIGVGVGYLGSYLAVGLGFLVSPNDHATLFLLIAIAFFAFSVPCFLFVAERGNPLPRPILTWSAIRESTIETWHVVRDSRRYPGLVRFLVGRVFYTDSINTVIAYMGLLAVNIAVATGLTPAQGRSQAQLVMMSAITFAVIGGFVWGRMVDAIGPKKTLTTVLWLWFVTFALAAATAGFSLPIFWLYVIAALAGIALGGIWAADRPYMLRLTPPDRIGEFYGLYGMVGRFSFVSGPLLWTLVMYFAVDRAGLTTLQGQALAIVSLLVVTVIGYWILRPVSDAPRNWEANPSG
ncbi:MAG: MFS transporter [Acidobacteriota bacterium]